MTETIGPSQRALRRSQTDQAQFLKRWLAVWVALLTVVVLVVIVFLLRITSSLDSINTNLETTDPDLVNAGGNVFESDRDGSQQLYVMGTDGTGQRRISFGELANRLIESEEMLGGS